MLGLGGKMLRDIGRSEDGEILRGLLEAVALDGARSQRSLASELGIALGLVNAYLKRCVRKGLVKVSEAPARRYAYYLTPQGFAEKSRLTVEYLSHSFNFFRLARADCSAEFGAIRQGKWERIVLIGASDLSEIALICALEAGARVVAIVDPSVSNATHAGLPVVASLDAVQDPFDAVLITELRQPEKAYEAACGRFGVGRVFAPKLLGLAPYREGAKS